MVFSARHQQLTELWLYVSELYLNHVVGQTETAVIKFKRPPDFFFFFFGGVTFQHAQTKIQQ